MGGYGDESSNWFEDPALTGHVPAAAPPAPGAAHAVDPAPAFAVAVVEPDPQMRGYMAHLLGDGVAGFDSVDALVPLLSDLPVVLVLGPSLAAPASLDQVDRTLRHHPQVATVLLAVELNTAVLQQALRAGVKDVLAMPVDHGQLLGSVQRIAADLQALAPRRAPQVLVPEAPVPIPLAMGEGFEPGRVITVFSTKGGAGKSVIASNLAVLLAQRSERPVCLVDADLQFGDVAVMLKLAPQHTIVDAVATIDRLDETLLRSLLSVHDESGLLVLPAPLEPAFADQIGATEMVHVVELLRNFCEFVVVDTPAYFNDVVLGLIDTSDDVLLVAGMDIPNIKNVKIGLQTLRLLNTPMEKVRLILNRANSKVKLEVAEVERTLQITADSLVPSDVVVPQSVNRGVPVVLSTPKSAVAKSLQQLADLFLPVAKTGRRR
jgi:pilus assembly protein CpaE